MTKHDKFIYCYVAEPEGILTHKKYKLQFVIFYFYIGQIAMACEAKLGIELKEKHVINFVGPSF